MREVPESTGLFQEELEKSGLVVHSLVADGNLHRVPVDGIAQARPAAHTHFTQTAIRRASSRILKQAKSATGN